MIIRDRLELTKSQPVCHPLKGTPLFYDIHITCSHPYIKVLGKAENVLITKNTLCFFANLPLEEMFWQVEVTYEYVGGNKSPPTAQ